jgi:hypothetical protein
MSTGTNVESSEASKNTSFASDIAAFSKKLSAGKMSGVNPQHVTSLRKKHRSNKKGYTKLEKLAKTAADAASDIRAGDAESGEKITAI